MENVALMGADGMFSPDYWAAAGDAADPVLVALAWGFVGSRVVHSAIHCSYNNVNHRFAVYVAGSLFLLLFWVRLAAFILVN